MNRQVGERCVEIARQVRDGGLRRDFGAFVAEHDSQCLQCGCLTVAIEYEHATDGAYCDRCHQEISQSIYDHEVGLLASGYYG
jgi:hypothetical protein